VKLVAAPGDRRYLFSPTGANAPLFNHAVSEDTITHIAERSNVPQPITRREMWDDVNAFYPSSMSIRLGNTTLPASAVSACDLSDFGAGWAYAPTTTALIDPVLGRLSLPATITVDGQPVDTQNPIVTFHYGFPAEMGGGPYARVKTFTDDITPLINVSSPDTIQSALGILTGSGAIEIKDNTRYVAPPAITAPQGARIEVRAADGRRPTVALSSELVVNLAQDSEVTLNGLLLLGASIRIPASSKRWHPAIATLHARSGNRAQRRRHTTTAGGAEHHYRIRYGDCRDRSLDRRRNSRARRLDRECDVEHRRRHRSNRRRVFRGGWSWPGGEVRIVNSTVIGKVHTRVLRLVSNSILSARLAELDVWKFPVTRNDAKTAACASRSCRSDHARRDATAVSRPTRPTRFACNRSSRRSATACPRTAS
jgi:hypothetical protein